MRIVRENYLNCLTEIYQDCTRHAKISNISFYAKTYGISTSIGLILQQLGYLQKHGNAKSSVYSIKAMRKPDETMVNEVLDALNAYSTKYAIKAKTAKQPVISSNLIPASEYKSKIKAEIASEIKAEVTSNFIRAAFAAKILGVDLFSLKKDQIDKFVEAIQK